MFKHEKMCFNNPENYRPCFNCRFLTKKTTEIFGSKYYVYGTGVASLLFCEKKQIFLYTPKNEINGNHYDVGDGCNIPMPKSCNDYNNDMNNFPE